MWRVWSPEMPKVLHRQRVVEIYTNDLGNGGGTALTDEDIVNITVT